MARPIKKGLDYFPMDCDSDDKIYELETQLGGEGCWRLIKIWKEIYKWEGYYIDWDEKQVGIFAKKYGYKIGYINKLIEVCLDLKLFNREKFEKYHILTSSGIQRRYLNIARIRKSLTVVKEYLIESIHSFIEEENIKLKLIPVNSKLTRVKSELNRQRKGKEIKVKEKKINSSLHILLTEKKEDKKPVKKDYSSGEYNPIWLTEKEYQKLADRFGKEDTDDKIYEFSTYSKYDKYTNHYSTLLNWLKKDKQQEQGKEHQIEEEEFEPGSYVNFRKVKKGQK